MAQSKRAKRALRCLAHKDAAIRDVVAAARVLSDACGGWSAVLAQVNEWLLSGAGTGIHRVHVWAACLRCCAARDHLRAERDRIEQERENEAAGAATDQEVVDAAVDVILRQPRRRRREIIHLLEHRGPVRYTWEDGGGI